MYHSKDFKVNCSLPSRRELNVGVGANIGRGRKNREHTVT